MSEIKIPGDKEAVIYKAALAEFSKNGYDLASTNKIVNSIDISKGTLFNYFGNKRNLYIFVVKKVLDFLTPILLEDIKNLSPDFFERISQVSAAKLKLTLQYPEESNILLESFGTKFEDFKKELQSEYDKYVVLSNKLLLDELDFSKFKSGIDVQVVFNMLLFIGEGFSKQITTLYKSDYKKILENRDFIQEEYNKYINIIRTSVYKDN
ncbi:TetR/AcrR family transcriptional regulator [Inconstantimicrobium mannanitabidum]|uniref:TetR family transcriptional regulator n=1 Tax=Inconstantimicrobium mannanitabidum TaxID=1604901 RepID=A0ACB5R741_9CLOT|nr:TetR/AcrR family transcriptional regulator [Clostridium sp. TW13]GKX65009.1 TetR family transcriptional regulator [Clostridium sp. TW13]